MTTTFMIAVQNGLATLPDQKQTCLYCTNDATDTFLGKLVCKIHLMAKELAEGY